MGDRAADVPGGIEFRKLAEASVFSSFADQASIAQLVRRIALGGAQDILRERMTMAPSVFAYTPHGLYVALVRVDAHGKAAAFSLVHEILCRLRAQCFVVVAETWAREVKDPADVAKMGPVRDYEDRVEKIMCSLHTPAESRFWLYPIERCWKTGAASFDPDRGEELVGNVAARGLLSMFSEFPPNEGTQDTVEPQNEVVGALVDVLREVPCDRSIHVVLHKGDVS